MNVTEEETMNKLVMVCIRKDLENKNYKFLLPIKRKNMLMKNYLTMEKKENI